MAFVLFHSGASITNIDVQGNTGLINAGGVAIQITGEGIASPICTAGSVVIQNNSLFSYPGITNGVDLNENGTNDMQIQSVNVNDNHFYNFLANPVNTINLDPSSSVILNRSVGENYIQTGI